MPHSSQTPTTIDRTPAEGAPSAHPTRRARIEAERAAAGRRGRPAAPAPTVDRAGAPVTPPAPSSPVLPTSSVGPRTPPAPSSPVVAPVRGDEPSGRARRTNRPAVARPTRAARQAPATSARASRTATAPRVDRATRHIPRTAPTAPAATHGASFRRTASRVTVVGSLLFAAGLVVSTSLPAQALYVPETGTATVRSAQQGVVQTLSVGDSVVMPTDRDAYTVSEAAPVPVAASSTGTPSVSADSTGGAIRWPFPTAVPISSGFGARQVAGCSFCSTFHQGADFAPGEGTPIHAVAAGTVIKVQANDGGFGNDVWVQHDVDGKQFVSVYGHMEDNSFKVVQGQQVVAGDELGLVGSTGNSTGPHLHLEIHVDGIPVDPLAWLAANVD